MWKIFTNFLIGIGFIGIAYAAAIPANQIIKTPPFQGYLVATTTNGYVEATTSPTVGWLTATSTTATSTLQNILFRQGQGTGLSVGSVGATTICLTGDTCRTTWPIGAQLTYNPFTAASFVATSSATSTFSGGIESPIIGASVLFATSTTVSSSFAASVKMNSPNMASYIAYRLGIATTTPSSALGVAGNITLEKGGNRSISVAAPTPDTNANSLSISSGSGSEVIGDSNGGALFLRSGQAASGNNFASGGAITVAVGDSLSNSNGSINGSNLNLTAGLAGGNSAPGPFGGSVVVDGGACPPASTLCTPGYILLNTTNYGKVGIATTSPYSPLSVVGFGGVVAENFTSTSTIATSTFPDLKFTQAQGTGLSVSNFSLLGTATGCAQFTGTLLTSSGVACAVSTGYPFTPSTSWGATVQSTTSELAFPQGLISSSTIGNLTAGTITATTTGTAITSAGNYNFSLASSTINSVGTPFIVSYITEQNYGFGDNSMGLEGTGAVGNFNTAFGSHALGHLTGDSSSLGRFNTAVGRYSLEALTTGYSNTAIGNGAGAAITSEHDETALGGGALQNWKDVTACGGLNVAAGSQAMQNSTQGCANTAIGYNALYQVTGSNNSAFGMDSGFSLGNGSANIFIGEIAALNQTAGSSNILIGQGMDLPSLTGSNQLDIGNTIYGTGLTATGQTVNTGAKIGISTSSPAAILDTYAATASTTNLLIESSSKGGCFIMKDVQGTGYTQVTAQAGVLTAKVATSLTTCN